MRGDLDMTLLFSVAFGGLMGACGVILAASASHGPAQSASLQSAAYMLLVHAVAVVAGASLMDRDVLWRGPLVLGILAWIIGASLFSGQIAAQAFLGRGLFPMAAPTGGTIMIAGWIAITIAACGAFGKR